MILYFSRKNHTKWWFKRNSRNNRL